MRSACLLLYSILVAGASADIVYTYSFQTLPTGWAADSHWTFTPSGGATMDISASGGPGSTVSSEMESDSAPILLYSGTDSVNVSLTCTYTLEGWYTSGESYADIGADAVLDGTDAYTILYDSDYWGWKRENEGTDAVYEVTFAASEGQLLTFDFVGHAGAFGAYAHAEWSITSLVVTAFGPTGLEQQSWGAIKSLF